MKELLSRFVALEKRLSDERGGFAVFALFLREDAVDKWDLVIAAPWIEEDRKNALSYVTAQLQAEFTSAELSLISRIVLIDLGNPAVESMNQAIAIRHGQAEVRDSNFFGLQIKHAYIITSERRKAKEKVLA
jgi:hypothetical protein